jgi:hypothetical protein
VILCSLFYYLNPNFYLDLVSDPHHRIRNVRCRLDIVRYNLHITKQFIVPRGSLKVIYFQVIKEYRTFAAEYELASAVTDKGKNAAPDKKAGSQDSELYDDLYNPESPVGSEEEEVAARAVPRTLVSRKAGKDMAANPIQINLKVHESERTKRSGAHGAGPASEYR